jgi:succinate dehydrogenase / fumarate reductase iron-sulfur subunit
MNPNVTDATRQPATSNGRTRTFRVRIRRQATPDAEGRWEDFEVPHRPNMNIISCLQWIAAHPTTADGKATDAPVWDSGCLEEVCGSCTMVINGKASQACSALVDKLSPDGEPITLEPMSKFPLVRDLYVDRSRLFDDLKRVKAWVPIDGTFDLGPGPTESQETQEERYPLSRCMSCGCCLEACPQYTPVNGFVGAAVISQVRLFNEHKTGAALKDDRMAVMMGEDGIGNCSKAGNCVQVCPKDIPLLESIAKVQREATWYSLKKLIGR